MRITRRRDGARATPRLSPQRRCVRHLRTFGIGSKMAGPAALAQDGHHVAINDRHHGRSHYSEARRSGSARLKGSRLGPIPLAGLRGGADDVSHRVSTERSAAGMVWTRSPQADAARRGRREGARLPAAVHRRIQLCIMSVRGMVAVGPAQIGGGAYRCGGHVCGVLGCSRERITDRVGERDGPVVGVVL